MKLLILGLSCSGKTTLSKHISKIIKVPYYNLDLYYWNKCWEKNLDFDINTIIDLNDWIVDGNYYEEEFEKRLNICDLIIYINIPLVKRLCRMIKRHFKYIKNPELHDAVSNKINLTFIISTIKKQLLIQPKLIKFLKKNYNHKLIYLKKIEKAINIKNEEDIYKLLNAH